MEIFECKYYLRCGMCELKRKPCTYFTPYCPEPYPWKPKDNIAVTVYGCPTWEVTCNMDTGDNNGTSDL